MPGVHSSSLASLRAELLEHFQFFRRLLGRMVLDRADHLLERKRLQHLQPTPLA